MYEWHMTDGKTVVATVKHDGTKLTVESDDEELKTALEGGWEDLVYHPGYQVFRHEKMDDPVGCHLILHSLSIYRYGVIDVSVPDIPGGSETTPPEVKQPVF